MDWKTDKVRETVNVWGASWGYQNRDAENKTFAFLQRKTFLSGVTKRFIRIVSYIKRIIIMSVFEFPFMLSFFITQLSATSTSRAAFMQCLRWGIWCPFQEPDVWKGEERQLVLQGGAKPNPHGVMVYSTQTSAKKTHGSAALSARDAAQVTQQHRECIF